MLPRLYNELAAWFPLLSPLEDYTEEAEFYWRTLVKHSGRPPGTILELGCGGGHNAFFLKKKAAITLSDLSPAMLAMSRSLNPECGHIQGDMRTVRLNREFDVVFIHDAISHMLTPEDLGQTLRTAFVHCRPGGAVMFMPDYTAETFKPGTEQGGKDGRDKAMRYLEWTWDPDPRDKQYTVDFAFLLRDREGRMQCDSDRFICGLFSLNEWLETIRQAGFEPRMVPFEHSLYQPGDYNVFVGFKPAV